MIQQEIEQIIAEFPKQNWFIDLLNENINELIHKDLIVTIEKVISRVFVSGNIVSSHYELEVIYQLSWEQINIGMFKDVPTKWREIFAISCLLLVFINLRNLSACVDFLLLKRCLYLCDMSLMMGGELGGDINFGSVIASRIHRLMSREKDVLIKDRQLLKECDFDPYRFVPYEIRDNVTPLDRIDDPSITQFVEILKKGEPVIITNLINDWPALSTNQWSVDYVRNVCGYRTVPVEIGSTYADSDWSQRLLTINEFIDEYFYDNIDGRKAYLAQHYLFSQISELNRDIMVPDYCLINGDHDNADVDINAWFGPSGTVSPLHQDPKHNFLCQVFGEKYVKLYLPSQTEFLYPNSTTMLKNTSQIDVFRPDLEEFPLFAKAKGFDGVLKSGEILFIPPKCWHYVKSISSSFSVNFWWNYI